MAQTYKTRYGIDFDADWPDTMIDLLCWKKWREYPFNQVKYAADECFLKAATALLTPDQFVISRWTEEHAHDWTYEDFIITWGCASSSKAQPLDAAVITPSGVRQMGDIRLGDKVIAQDGAAAAVVKTHDVGMQEEYRVIFSDGTSTLCAGSHLWEVRPRRTSPTGCSRVVSAEWLSKCAEPGRYSIPLCAPVQFEAQPIQIDPYVMGALLGDGSFGGSAGNWVIRFSSADEDIVTHFRGRLEPGYRLNVIPGKPQDHCLVREGSRGRMPNKYIRALKTYGLWAKCSPEKHIPSEYLHNTEQVRRDILAGLLDTDGGVSAGGAVTYSTTSDRLVQDVIWLVQSLGGMARCSTHKSGYRKDGAYIKCRPAHVLNIALYGVEELFRCQRKGERAARRSTRGTARRYISRTERTGRRVPMKCITIDRERGLYLTDSFIATHNSNDYGLLTLMDWAVDPSETISVLASTTKAMLKVRSFESVTRYFKQLKANRQYAIPGLIAKSLTAIINDESEDETATEKASIRGVAVAEGTEEEANSKLRGAHLPYVRLVLDELSQMRAAAMSVRTNMAIGARNFKVVGLTNIDSFYDLAGQYSTPLDGWGSVGPDTHFWRTQWGIVRRHDGTLSPAITEPDGDKKYPHLLTKKVLDQIVAQEGGNWDAPQIWTMIRAWPPAEGKKQVVMTEAEIASWHMHEDGVIWGNKAPVVIGGLDPAFVSGGDNCILQLAEAGWTQGGGFVIRFLDTHRLKIEASTGEPAIYQIVRQVKEHAFASGLQPENLAVDDSGTQSVADVIDREWAPGCMRVSFGAKPDDSPVSEVNPQPQSKRYRDMATALWYSMREYGSHDQIRRLPVVAGRQFSLRGLEKSSIPIQLISKAKLKKLIHTSPDEGDACALALCIPRYRMGIYPGATTERRSGLYGASFSTDIARRYDLDGAGTGYSTPGI